MSIAGQKGGASCWKIIITRAAIIAIIYPSSSNSNSGAAAVETKAVNKTYTLSESA